MNLMPSCAVLNAATDAVSGVRGPGWPVRYSRSTIECWPTDPTIRADGSLSCVNQTLVNRFAPTSSSLIVSVGTPIPLGMLSITCDAPSPGPLAVTVVETGATIALVDGNGSGQFAGTYTPVGPGTKTLAFPNGDSVSVTAVGNYDPALIVPFDFPAITGTQLPLQCDDCVATIEVPFPIPFAGASPGLTTLHISSNGLLSFSAPIASFSNSPLPVPFVDTLVAPFWDDLLPSAGGSIRYEVLGQAPGRQLVIEYRDVPISRSAARSPSRSSSSRAARPSASTTPTWSSGPGSWTSAPRQRSAYR
jgi:serine protease